MNHVKTKDLAGALRKIRDLRAWAAINDVDPWAVRQALIMALETDTDAALERGITPEALKHFDQEVKQHTREWLKQKRGE